MPLKVAIRRCATSSECGCAGKRKLGYLYLGAAELGSRAFRNAAKPRIQRRSKSRRACPDSPTTFRTHEMSWTSPSLIISPVKRINEYNRLYMSKLLNTYCEH